MDRPRLYYVDEDGSIHNLSQDLKTHGAYRAKEPVKTFIQACQEQTTRYFHQSLEKFSNESRNNRTSDADFKNCISIADTVQEHPLWKFFRSLSWGVFVRVISYLDEQSLNTLGGDLTKFGVACTSAYKQSDKDSRLSAKAFAINENLARSWPTSTAKQVSYPEQPTSTAGSPTGVATSPPHTANDAHSLGVQGTGERSAEPVQLRTSDAPSNTASAYWFTSTPTGVPPPILKRKEPPYENVPSLNAPKKPWREGLQQLPPQERVQSPQAHAAGAHLHVQPQQTRPATHLSYRGQLPNKGENYSLQRPDPLSSLSALLVNPHGGNDAQPTDNLARAHLQEPLMSILRLLQEKEQQNHNTRP